MKKCSDLEHLMPLYAEGVLSQEEKRTVEEHLAGCEACRRELAYLKKAGELVSQLPEVEEPPWFQQKIMAGVRKEAEKKSFAQKWFRPLYFRIPLQVMATIVIAVLAVYIYRSGDEQVKSILPGAQKPALEVMKEQPDAPLADEGKAVVTVPARREKTAVPEKIRQDKPAAEVGAVSENIQKPALQESGTGAAYETDVLSAKGLKEDKIEVHTAPPAERNKLSSAEEQRKDQERTAQDQTLSAGTKKKETYKMAAPAAQRALGEAAGARQPSAKSEALISATRVVIRVNDPDAAAREAEKILVRYDAKRLSRQKAEGSMILHTAVSAGDWKEILAKLKTIGPVEEKDSPADVSGMIRVTIEISVK